MTLRVSSTSRARMRRMNEASVFGIIHDFGPIARAEIASMSGLSLATISGITGALIDDGIVVEQRAGESTGGRRPSLLAIDRSAAVAIGVKLINDRVVVALTDLGAELIELRSAPLGDDLSPEAVVEILGGVIDGIRAAHPDRRFIGLGLGMAGVIDRVSGTCRFSPFLPWRDVQIRDLIQQRINLPVFIENDVNALTIAERWFGEGSTSPNFLVVTIGRGVGMGIMLNGDLYRGGQSGAGEFGHMTIVEGGPRCNCGKDGCVEAYVSEASLQRAIRQVTGTSISLDDAVAKSESGDAQIAAIFARAGHVFGLALAGVVSILNPTLIIIGGEGTRFIDLLMPSLVQALETHSFDHFFDDVRLVVEPWGDDVWARGAAALALDEYFHPAAARAAANAFTVPAAESGRRPGRVPRPG
jgi:N-acetylglucosamine repressor